MFLHTLLRVCSKVRIGSGLNPSIKLHSPTPILFWFLITINQLSFVFKTPLEVPLGDLNFSTCLK